MGALGFIRRVRSADDARLVAGLSRTMITARIAAAILIRHTVKRRGGEMAAITWGGCSKRCDRYHLVICLRPVPGGKFVRRRFYPLPAAWEWLALVCCIWA